MEIHHCTNSKSHNRSHKKDDLCTIRCEKSDLNHFRSKIYREVHSKTTSSRTQRKNATEEGETQSKEIKKKVKEKQQVFSNPIKELLQAINPKDQLQSHCTNTIIR